MNVTPHNAFATSKVDVTHNRGDSTMRIAILGNLANVGALLTDYLNRSGVNCDLLAPPDELRDLEPNLRSRISGRTVELVHIAPSLAWGVVCRLLPRVLSKRLSLYYRYDIIISMAGYNRVPWLLRVPFVAIATGSDLREESYKPRASVLYRWGFRQSKMVLSWLFDSRSLDKVEMFGLSQFRFFRFPVDTERYSPRTTTFPELDRHDFVVYSPTRQDWVNAGRGRWAGGQKGNDRLIRGFARFLQANTDARSPLLILMNTGVDADRTKELVRSLGIEAHVVYRDYLGIDDRIDLINASDVVADHFCAGSFGGTFVEVLACGKPLLHYLEMDNIDLAYPDRPPVLNAGSEEEICAGLLSCLDPEVRQRLGDEARAWILRHHRWESVTATLIHYLRMIYGRGDVLDISTSTTGTREAD
jgi:glycosyltransferase involved in cell wall biosynthesis